MRFLDLRRWRLRDTELRGLAGDSLYVGIWQGAVSVADLVQIALITHVLGLSELGSLALAMSFVLLIGQFFDVRVGAAATTFGAGRIAARDVPGLSCVIQFSYLIDASTGLLGFAVVAALAPFVGPHLIADNGTSLILLYGLTLLISTVDESSVSVLRLLDHFRLLAGYTLGLEVLRVAMVAVALGVSPSLTSVLVALVLYDVAGAAANLIAATRAFRLKTQTPLQRLALAQFKEKRRMLRMVLHTNVVSYARIAQTQLPTLLVGALGTATAVGIYKVGTAAAAIVARVSDPAYAAVLPRLARLWAAGRSRAVRMLVAQSTLIASGAVSLALILVLLLRYPILELLGGDKGRAAVAVLVLVSIGQAVNGALFWNVGLLYATGRSGIVAVVALIGLVVQISLVALLVPSHGADGAAIALLSSLIATNAVATALCLRVLAEGAAKDSSRAARAAESAYAAPRLES
jgi:O-antigen/teichoic acid export membrane protein